MIYSYNSWTHRRTAGQDGRVAEGAVAGGSAREQRRQGLWAETRRRAEADRVQTFFSLLQRVLSRSHRTLRMSPHRVRRSRAQAERVQGAAAVRTQLDVFQHPATQTPPNDCDDGGKSPKYNIWKNNKTIVK